MPRGVGAGTKVPILVDATLREADESTAKNIVTQLGIAPLCVPFHEKSTSKEGPSKQKTRGQSKTEAPVALPRSM